MIIVRIVGGLSSQSHKCAVGRALALRLGTEPKLDLDWFDNPPTTDSPWPYQLETFSLGAGVAKPQEVRRVRGHPCWNRVVRRVNRQWGLPLLSTPEVNIGTLTPAQWV